MTLMRVVRTAVTAGALVLGTMLPAQAVTLNIANGADPGSLDPHKAAGDWEDRIISELFEGLVAEGPEAVAVPGQAESWTISPDGIIYTFTLRADALWSDGEPVVAQHFVDGFRRLFDPETAAQYAYLQFPIRNAEAMVSGELTDPEELGVTAVDRRTLQITLEAPTAYFIEALAHLTALPIRKDVIERWGDQWTQPGNIVGNGPYQLVEWVPGSHLRAVRSSTFHDAANVAIDEVNWINSQDIAAAFNRYRAGEIDLLTEFPAEQYGFLEQMHPGEARVQPYLGMTYFELNQERPPFADARVREALSISLVREVFGPDVLGTGELAAYGWVPPGVANYPDTSYRPVWADQPIVERRERARALLAEAGFGADRPLGLQLRFYTNDTQRRLAIAVAAMWKEIGVDTELHDAETVAHFSAMEAGDFDVGAGGWLLDYNDASNTLDLLRGPTTDRDRGLYWGNNYGHFNSQEFDELLDAAAGESDLSTRAALLREAEGLAMEAFAAIPLYWSVSRIAVSPRISGFVDNVENIHRVRWLAKAE